MKMFGNSVETPITTLQLFEPDARAVYTLEAAASLTQLPRRLIVSLFQTRTCVAGDGSRVQWLVF